MRLHILIGFFKLAVATYHVKRYVKNKQHSYERQIQFILEWFDLQLFYRPYPAFLIGVLPAFPWSYGCENHTSVGKRIEVWLNMIFRVIDIPNVSLALLHWNTFKFVDEVSA